MKCTSCDRPAEEKCTECEENFCSHCMVGNLCDVCYQDLEGY